MHLIHFDASMCSSRWMPNQFLALNQRREIRKGNGSMKISRKSVRSSPVTDSMRKFLETVSFQKLKRKVIFSTKNSFFCSSLFVMECRAVGFKPGNVPKFCKSSEIFIKPLVTLKRVWFEIVKTLTLLWGSWYESIRFYGFGTSDGLLAGCGAFTCECRLVGLCWRFTGQSNLNIFFICFLWNLWRELSSHAGHFSLFPLESSALQIG